MRRVLIVVCAATAVTILNTTMVNIALPLIGRDLAAGPAQLGWIITGYFILAGVATPFYGRLGDIYGARRLFVTGLSIFTAGSLLCALAPSYGVLIAGRLLQGVGSASSFGLGLAIVSAVYPPSSRGRALSVVSATVGTAAAIGPTLGGLLAGALDWHLLFGVSALAGLVIPFALRLLPPGARDGDRRVDWLGGLFLGLLVGAVLLGITEAARRGPGEPLVLACAGTAVLAAGGLGLRQARAPRPFVSRELLANRLYVRLVAMNFGFLGADVPVVVALPLLLTQHNDLSPAQVGLVLLPQALAFAVTGLVAGRVVDRIGTRGPLRVGLLVFTVGLFLLSSYGAGGPVWVASALATLPSAGTALVLFPISASVSLVVGRESIGAALGINDMCFLLGVSVGTALLTAILALRAGAERALNPLYAGPAAAYSDAFLLGCLPPLLVLLAALTLPRIAAER